MKNIAHRGYSLNYKDNSITSIKQAINRKYDGVEIDIQLCRTGEIVLYHDIYIKTHFVSELSLKELKLLGVVSLEDVYRIIPSIKNTLLLLDIKGNDMEVVNVLKKKYDKMSSENVIFCSLNRNIIYDLPSYFKKCSTFEIAFRQNEYEFITHGLYAIMVHWTCLDDLFIDYCQKKNIKVFTYTHKEEKELEYMKKYNIDAIITNGF